MEIKPIKLIQGIKHAEIPDAKIDKNQPRIPVNLKPPPGKWNFQQGRIILNGRDIGNLIQESANMPADFWVKLANDLDQFRTYYLRRNSKKRKKKIGDEEITEELDPTGELGQLHALVEAYIAKIMRLLKRKYNEKEDGVSFMLDEQGQLTLNGINITSFIQMARKYPSEKARLFLKGLKNRLTIILSNKSNNSNYDKIRDVTLSLFKDIDEELKRIVEKDHLIGNT